MKQENECVEQPAPKLETNKFNNTMEAMRDTLRAINPEYNQDVIDAVEKQGITRSEVLKIFNDLQKLQGAINTNQFEQK